MEVSLAESKIFEKQYNELKEEINLSRVSDKEEQLKREALESQQLQEEKQNVS